MTEPIKFENAPISIFQSKGMNGGPSRRVFITVTDLESIPDELFAVKLSQSKNPEIAGKAVFRHFSYKANENTPFSTIAPPGTTLSTPTSETKAAVIGKLGAIPGIKFSIIINLNGKFENIKTSQGTFTIYDDAAFPETEGKPGYYLKSGTIATVTLEKGESQYVPYYKVQLETDLSPDEVFVRSGKSKVWGADEADTDTVDTEEVNTGAAW